MPKKYVPVPPDQRKKLGPKPKGPGEYKTHMVGISLTDDEAVAFEQFLLESGAKTRAAGGHALIIHKLRDLGYLPNG